jgi:hypothetical protein
MEQGQIALLQIRVSKALCLLNLREVSRNGYKSTFCENLRCHSSTDLSSFLRRQAEERFD